MPSPIDAETDERVVKIRKAYRAFAELLGEGHAEADPHLNARLGYLEQNADNWTVEQMHEVLEREFKRVRKEQRRRREPTARATTTERS